MDAVEALRGLKFVTLIEKSACSLLCEVSVRAEPKSPKVWVRHVGKVEGETTDVIVTAVDDEGNQRGGWVSEVIDWLGAQHAV